MPILDMKIWVDTSNAIVHEHYAKDVSSRYTVHTRSAMAVKTKRQILTQDALRILLNCSRRLPWNTKVQHLRTYVMRMQFSGYDQKFRHEIIDSAVKAYRRIEAADEAGERPMYRERGWQWEQREVDKRDSKSTWFRKGGYQSVMFIPSTPGSQLMKRFQKEISQSRFGIQVVELSGRSLKNRRFQPIQERGVSEKTVQCVQRENEVRATISESHIRSRASVEMRTSVRRQETRMNGEASISTG